MSLTFELPVALFFTPVANLLLCGWILLPTGNFTWHSIKAKSSMLSHNRRYKLWPLITVQILCRCSTLASTSTLEFSLSALMKKIFSPFALWKPWKAATFPSCCCEHQVPCLCIWHYLHCRYIIVVEHDLSVLDYLSDYICCLYGAPGAYGVVTMPFSVREGKIEKLSSFSIILLDKLP